MCRGGGQVLQCLGAGPGEERLHTGRSTIVPLFDGIAIISMRDYAGLHSEHQGARRNRSPPNKLDDATLSQRNPVQAELQQEQ